MKWMVYGANGYTGQLVARMAAETGEKPVLAGRSADAITGLAQELRLEHHVFDLRDHAAAQAALEDVDAVAHCAGPYTATAAPMLSACLTTRTHYLDLTGEFRVFETVYGCHAAAVEAGITLVPGAGFDVVPTDHLIAALGEHLGTIVDAEVAAIPRGGFSGGTLTSAFGVLKEGNRIRVNGALENVPVCHRKRTLPLPGGRLAVHSVPLGDLISAYHGYGIPNITAYTVVPGASVARISDNALRAIASSPINGAITRAVRAFASGPSTETLRSTRSEAWAEVRDATGRVASRSVSVSNTYDFTARSMLQAVKRLAHGDAPAGAWTPAQAFGTGFLFAIPGAHPEYGPARGRPGGLP